ncbi:MAG: NAD(P)/FAD-dependent oxidoreductase [Dehalococcoidia bacterium]|nr:NAD(P)/FAD-dependent oxidoreductase [Dehalococcoidia bacterium]
MSIKQVLVIGGGAGGMLAAGRAAELGAEVTLLEKMERPGKKVLLSGNGRCNLSNTRDIGEFITMFGPNGRFLYHAFHHFFRDDLLKLLAALGVMTLAEPDGRIFPVSGKSTDVVKALQKYMSGRGVKVLTGVTVTAIEIADNSTVSVKTSAAGYPADSVVLATGGASYPQTGSTGDGYRMAAKLGHSIVSLRPALVPLTVKERQAAASLQGISLSDARLTSFSCRAEDIDVAATPRADRGRGLVTGKSRSPVVESRRGSIVFTQDGLSGPAALLMSLSVADAMKEGPVSLAIDLQPGKTLLQLSEDLKTVICAHGGRQVKSILNELLPERIALAVLMKAGVPADTGASQVTSIQRQAITRALKGLAFNAEGVRPLTEAMVTAGGVSLKEVDPRTMQSKIIRGLYFCGEVLDLDADTGGFNLQAAFSTGYMAGECAARAR